MTAKAHSSTQHFLLGTTTAHQTYSTFNMLNTLKMQGTYEYFFFKNTGHDNMIYINNPIMN